MDANFIADPTRLVIVALLGLALLLFLIIRLKLHSLIAILVTAAFIGFGSGMPASLVLDAFSTGVTNTLGSIALIVGLGAMFGGLLAATGAADVLANTLIAKFGTQKASIAIGITSLLVGVPVFYDAAFIILLPLVFQVALRTNKSVLTYVIPMVAGIGLSQMIAPTPGPIIISGQLEANLGLMTFLSIFVVIPSWIISGYFFGKILGKRIYVPVPDTFANKESENKGETASFKTILLIIIIPILLILLNTGSSMIDSESAAGFKAFAAFVGEPFVALTIANLIAIYVLGIRRGFKGEEIEKIMTKALNPVAIIVLVTAGGGVLRYMLDYSGTATLIGEFVSSMNLPIIVVAFVTAVALRVSVGSAVVSMTMTAGVLASLPQIAELSPSYLALVGLAVINGATSFSHVNDSGFWMFKEFLGLDLKTTFKTWTFYTGVASIVAFTFILIISIFV
ncbi:low-affinity gluconate/H+ symporter GntU [Halalkalibacter wakoensis JCM 9140]|uniref:Low-affinity gluconate/H+ symporter GntU n=1 Tax=Halalkalibacter wakoensis JCM 9140 TaxID=1236970 RepID=W4QAX3_9BACI|nr:gluconate:H+ symporter [Halalkalibacter wakoensis]GAE28519.1 low-affinity gluconate/H+ symporter GntU [Halalkalibacter wakoensis JCM 9140]